MMSMEVLRITTLKASVSEIVNGRFVKKNGLESSYVITELGRRLIRVRVLATVVEKYISDDSSYGTIILDDSFGTIRCKVFRDTSILTNITEGDIVDVIGKVREFQGEIYIVPEIIRKLDPNWETLRMLEIEVIHREQKEKIEKIKELQKTTADISELKVLAQKMGIQPEDVEAILEAKEISEEAVTMPDAAAIQQQILSIIERFSAEDGIDYADIISKSGLPETVVDTAITDLLEKGICYEVRAGRIKKM